jgi:hypothetical protein
MPQDALHPVRIDPGAKHERRSNVPQIVEAHRPRQGLGPQLRVALRASSQRCVCVPLD